MSPTRRSRGPHPRPRIHQSAPPQERPRSETPQAGLAATEFSRCDTPFPATELKLGSAKAGPLEPEARAPYSGAVAHSMLRVRVWLVSGSGSHGDSKRGLQVKFRRAVLMKRLWLSIATAMLL